MEEDLSSLHFIVKEHGKVVAAFTSKQDAGNWIQLLGAPDMKVVQREKEK